MKKLLLFLLLPLLNFGQTQFTEVIEMDSMKRATLYANSLEWFSKTFKSANEVIQMKDAETGKVIGEGILSTKLKSLGITVYGNTWVTISINSKDGKYKYEFTDIHFKYDNGNTLSYEKGKQAWKDEIDKEVKDLIQSLREAMAKSDEF